MNVLPIRQLAELSPEELAAEFQRRYDAWPCPECGGEVTAPRSKTVTDRRCLGCIEASGSFRRFGAVATPRTREAALEAAGCPARFRSPFQSRPWPSDPRDKTIDVSAWSGDPWAVGFLGDSDAGKTMLATKLFARNLRRTGSGLWARADRLVGCMMGREGETGRELGAQALHTPLLHIDDLGWGTLGASIEILFGIIAHRHAELLATTWTANHTNAQLGATLAGAAFTRRLQDGLMVPVTGNWKAAVAAGGTK
jgi:hypothetical protein